MDIAVFVFAYKRPRVLAACLRSLIPNIAASAHVSPGIEKINLIDDTPGCGILPELRAIDPDLDLRNVIYHGKAQSLGFGNSAQLALKLIMVQQPSWVLFIEGDHVYAANGIERIMAVICNQWGIMCAGIAGYDHPNFYRGEYIGNVFPRCMAQQLGEDNVNRAALHKPWTNQYWFGEPRKYVTLERVSNTCFTCYLNWDRIVKLAKEFPELWDYLVQACDPRHNPNYPDSGKYKEQGLVDDGMLSHGINLVWNKWAIKHGIDRNEYAAWLNIKPSVAQHISGGGLHAVGGEMTTDAGSPSWVG